MVAVVQRTLALWLTATVLIRQVSPSSEYPKESGALVGGASRWAVSATCQRRAHWGLQSWHSVREVTFGEDASQIHLGQAPDLVAVLRNAAINLLRWISSAPLIES